MDNKKSKHDEGRQKRQLQVDKTGAPLSAKASGSTLPLFGEPVCIQRDTNDLQKYAKHILGDYQTVVPKLDNKMLGIETLPSTPVQEGKRNVFDVTFQQANASHTTTTTLLPRHQASDVVPKKEHHSAKSVTGQAGLKRVSGDVKADSKQVAVVQGVTDAAESGLKQSNVLPPSYGKSQHKSKPVRPYNPPSSPPSQQGSVPVKAPKLVETDLFKDALVDPVKVAKAKKSKQRSETAKKAPPSQDVLPQPTKTKLGSNPTPNSTPSQTPVPQADSSSSAKLKKTNSSSSLARTCSNSSLLSSSNLPGTNSSRPTSSSPAFNPSAPLLPSLNPSAPSTSSSKEERHQEATPLHKVTGDGKLKKKCKKDKQRDVCKPVTGSTVSSVASVSARCTPLPSKIPEPHSQKVPELLSSKVPEPLPSKLSEPLLSQVPVDIPAGEGSSNKPRPGNLTIVKSGSMATILTEEPSMDGCDVLTILEEMTKPMLPMVTPIQTPSRKSSGDFAFPQSNLSKPVNIVTDAIKTELVSSLPLLNIQQVPAVLSPLSSDSDSESKHAVNNAVVQLDQVLDTEKLYPIGPPPLSSFCQPNLPDLMDQLNETHHSSDHSDGSSSSSEDSSSEDSSSDSDDSDSEELAKTDTTLMETSTLSKDDTLFLPLQTSMVTPLKKTPPQLELSHTSFDVSSTNYNSPTFAPQTNLSMSQSNVHFDSNSMPFVVSPTPVATITSSQVPEPFADTTSVIPISTVNDDLALSSENDSDSDSSDSESESGSSSSDSDDGSSCGDANNLCQDPNGEHQLNMSQTNEELLFPSPVNSPMCFDEEMGFDPMSQESQVTQLFGTLEKDLVPTEDNHPPSVAPGQMSTPILQPLVGVAMNETSLSLPGTTNNSELSNAQTEAVGQSGAQAASQGLCDVGGAQAASQGLCDVGGIEVESKKRSNRDLKRSQLAACTEHLCGQTAPKMEKETPTSQVAGKKRKWADPSLPSTAAPLKAPRLHMYNSVESTQGEVPSNDALDCVRAGAESRPVVESDQTLVIKIPLSLIPVKKKRMATVEPYHVTAPSEKAARRRSEGQESVEEDLSRRREIPDVPDFSRHREQSNQYSHEYTHGDDRSHTHRPRNWDYNGLRNRHGNTEGRHDYSWGDHYSSEYWPEYGPSHYDRGSRSDYEERRSRAYHTDRSLHNSKRSLQEARKKKHEADNIKIPGVEKAKAYMEAVTCFMKHGYSMEHDKLQQTSLFKLYQDTISMIKHSQTMAGNNQPLHVLCLRCQAALYMKLYALKQPAASAIHKELQEYFVPSAKNCIQKSPYPNSLSPIPSPASVGSTNSTTSATVVHSQDPSPSSTVTIPKHVVVKATEHLNITSYVNQSFELWRQSEQMAEHDSQFFTILDRKAGRISNGSPIIDVVEWIEQGLRNLR